MSTPEVPIHDGSMPLLIADVLERLHNLETFYNIVNALFAVALVLNFFAAFAVGLVMPSDGSAYTRFVHWQLVVPSIGIMILLVAGLAWAHNRSSNTRQFYNIVSIIWVLAVSALVVWLLVERFFVCPANLDLHCTDGVTSGIRWQYDFYFASVWAHWFFLVLQIIIFNQICRNIKLLMDPRTGTTRADLVTELYARPSRYLHSIGSSFAMDVYFGAPKKEG